MPLHVPEHARVLGGEHAGQCGAFVLPSPEPGWELYIIADDGTHGDVVPESRDWEHVSVHAARDKRQRKRTPTWKEMCFVKSVFWDPEDVVAQFHPPASEYVNVHPHVLHLWRHRVLPFPRPVPELV
jgi:hypothetical protein